MEVPALIVAGLALIAAGALGGIAYGFRGQRDSERDQVTYLRERLARALNEPPPSSSRSLTTVGGGGQR